MPTHDWGLQTETRKLHVLLVSPTYIMFNMLPHNFHGHLKSPMLLHILQMCKNTDDNIQLQTAQKYLNQK